MGYPIQKGSTGAEVNAAQSCLVSLGYLAGVGEIDGVFGTRTHGAVQLFQKAITGTLGGILTQPQAQILANEAYLVQNLRPTAYQHPKGSTNGSGGWGGTPSTSPVGTRRGSKGAGVQLLQETLIAKGFSCGPTGADGDFGINTENAVKAFQDAAVIPVTGVVDERTWAALQAWKLTTVEGKPDKPWLVWAALGIGAAMIFSRD